MTPRSQYPPWWTLGPFLYLIESPDKQEVDDGKGEGPIIAGMAKLLKIECVIRPVRTVAEFDHALEGVKEETRIRPNRAPIVHVSAHGHEAGFGFTDNSFRTWLQLGPQLEDLNRCVMNRLVLSLSTCKGLAAETLARPGHSQQPFALLAACRGEPLWSESALAFAAFYHILVRNKPIRDAAAAMNAASGRSDFQVFDPQTGQRA